MSIYKVGVNWLLAIITAFGGTGVLVCHPSEPPSHFTLELIGAFVLCSNSWQQQLPPFFILEAAPDTESEELKQQSLSVDQIRELIPILPDPALAGEIRDRGINFTLTKEIINELKQKGAGPQTIQALSIYLPKAALNIISTPPECDVYLDDAYRGRTNAEGRLMISDAEPGLHDVVIRKAHYQDVRYTVTLAAEKQEQITANLTWAVGFLTVTSNVYGASIDIERIGRFSGSVSNLDCPPGIYTITVSHSHYKTMTTEGEIVAGRDTTISVTLEVDPEFVHQLIADARQAFSNKDYDSAISSARELLSYDPKNGEALGILAQSHYNTGKYNDSITYLTKAIALGEPVTLPVTHRHAGKALGLDDDLCNGEVTLRKDAFEFRSTSSTTMTDRRVSMHDFSVPLNKIYELKYEPQKSGRLHAVVGIQKGSKEEQKKYDFYPDEASLQNVGSSSSSGFMVIYCDNCQPTTPMIYQLLQKLKQ
jgi:hypothetical protein